MSGPLHVVYSLSLAEDLQTVLCFVSRVLAMNKSLQSIHFSMCPLQSTDLAVLPRTYTGLKQFIESVMPFNMIQAHKAGLWMVLVLSVVVICTEASNNEDGTIILERGHPGILSCPPAPFSSGHITLDQIDAIFWFLHSLRDENMLISYKQEVAPQNGIPEGVYDINRNLTLVIENVTVSDEGTYFCRVTTRFKSYVDGHVAMRVKVSPKQPFPDVTQCTRRISGTACEAVLPYDIKKPMLTCIVQNVKPAVSLRWLLEYSDGDTQLISDRFTVTQSAYSVNTFTTSASIPIAISVDKYMYRCQAYGEGLELMNGSHVTVTVTTAPYTPTRPRFTTLQSTTTALAATFGDTSAVTGTPDCSPTAPTWLIVTLCLSFIANVGFVIAVVVLCKIWPRNPDGQASESNRENDRMIETSTNGALGTEQNESNV